LQIFCSRPKLVHWKAENVGWAGLVHPLHVKLLHCCLVDENDRELGIRVHVQLIESEGHKSLKRGLIDRDPRLIIDLDTHDCALSLAQR
jgi:hypothetical protein